MRFFLDVQLLLYVVFNSYPEHNAAHAWFEGVLNNTTTLVGLPTHSLFGFLRLSTQVLPNNTPISMPVALTQVEAWIALPNVFVPQPGQNHIQTVIGLMRYTGGGHGLVADAHLAALAIEHGATMCSHDNGFLRFPGLTVIDPTQPTLLPPP
jgi:toxin-antitoxin system PIN domain toxin